MKIHMLIIALCVVTCFGCDSNTKLKSLSNEEVNELLVQINEDSEVFVQKDISFDSIVTLAGLRILEDSAERIKFKLFFFGDYCRGYYNLADVDDKNLQFFGQKINETWTLKCVTKLNMTEADGYVILSDNYNGLWSNGNVNFRQGSMSLKKYSTDYTDLKDW